MANQKAVAPGNVTASRQGGNRGASNCCIQITRERATEGTPSNKIRTNQMDERERDRCLSGSNRKANTGEPNKPSPHTWIKTLVHLISLCTDQQLSLGGRLEYIHCQ